ncbi:MAG: hypothetical protein JWR26_4674 [Pedosphaera sp.]|nr:hypothetical protein [Pedosphaera sp.]
MKAVKSPKQYEFSSQQPENYILVESCEDGVVIRAARKNFSNERKSMFIRELAAEGFIPDQFQWFSDPDTSGYMGITWIIDSSWLHLHAAVRRESERRFFQLIGSASLLWLLVMGMMIFGPT